MAITGKTVQGNPWVSLFQTNFDKIIVAEANTGFMEANPENIQYNGGRTIKIAEIAVSGLLDYDRENGFESGTVTMNWKDYSLTQDRGVSFSIDRIDSDETGNMVTAGTVIGEFARTQMVPELDSYRWTAISKNFTDKATNGSQIQGVEADIDPTAAGAADALVKAIDAAITKFKEDAIPLAGCRIVLSPTMLNLASESAKFQKLVNTTVLRRGEVEASVNTYREVPLYEVPQAQLKETFASKVGGGFTVGGKSTNFILMKETGAAVGIVKSDISRIFAPEVNQKADAWKIDARVYHDLIIPANGAKQIYVHRATK